MKVIFNNSRGDRLYGTLHAHRDVHVGDKKPGIVLVHGFASNKNEAMGLFSGMGEFLHSHGFNVLRFDMTGAGESEGDYSLSTPNTMAKDVRYAVNYLKAVDYVDESRIGVVGMDLGALNSVMGWEQDVEAMVLLSPVLDTRKDMYERYESMGFLEIGREQGFFEKRGLKVGMELFSRFRELDTEPFMRIVKCPTLVVQGSWDKNVPVERTRGMMEYFGGRTDLKIIRGANHVLGGERTRKEVNRLSLNWFIRYFGEVRPSRILRQSLRERRLVRTP